MPRRDKTSKATARQDDSDLEENPDASEIIRFDEKKATKQMRASLARMYGLLTCPLCQKVFDQPTTLSSCAHSFCLKCIDNYGFNQQICPVPGCNMPMSVVGGHKGAYRKVNLQLTTMISSLNEICSTLERAPDKWWETEDSDKVQSGEDGKKLTADSG